MTSIEWVHIWQSAELRILTKIADIEAHDVLARYESYLLFSFCLRHLCTRELGITTSPKINLV